MTLYGPTPMYRDYTARVAPACPKCFDRTWKEALTIFSVIRTTRVLPSCIRPFTLRGVAASLLLVFAAVFATGNEARAAQLAGNLSVSHSLHSQWTYYDVDVSINYVTRAQKFTTGSNATGYALESVVVYVYGVEDMAEVKMSIYTATTNSSNLDIPGTSVYTLTNPATYSVAGWNHTAYTATALNTFTAPANATLEKDTDYFVVFENVGTQQPGGVDGPWSDYWFGYVVGGNEDSGGASGWSIDNGHLSQLGSKTAAWVRSSLNPFRIGLNGTTDTMAPSLDTATVNGTSLVLTYDEALDEDSEPATSAYLVSVAGGTGTAPSSVDVSDKTITLTLGTAVTNGQTVSVSYTVPTSDPVQDVASNDAVALTNQSVTNNTPVPNNAPEFATSSTTRSFPELVGDPVVQTAANVGAAITATDDDSDTLIYTMEGPGAGFFTIDSGDRSDQNQGRSKLRLRSAGGYLRVDGQGRRQQGRHGHDCSDHLPHGRGRGAAGTGSSCSVVD